MKETRSWSDTIRKIEPLVYQVRAGDSSGSAFAISIAVPAPGQYYTMFATAWHVVEKVTKTDDILDLKRHDGYLISNVTTGSVAIYPVGPVECDTALIAVPTSVPLVTSANLPALPLETMLDRGDELGWMGYPTLVSSSKACFFHGNVSGHLNEPPVYFVDGVGINGVSGGPAFDIDGLVVGIVSSYIPNQANRGITLPGLLMVIPLNLVRLWMQEILGASVLNRDS